MIARPSATVSCPESATHWLTALAGLLGFICSVSLLKIFQPFGDKIVYSAMFVMGFTAAAIFLVDILGQKVHRRASTGIDFGYDDPSWERASIKFAGLSGSLGFVAFLYWLFPEYHGSFYDNYYHLLGNLLPGWFALALPYIYFVDRRMKKPQDGYWQMGNVMLGRWSKVDTVVIGQHLLGWLIKGFFLPLMFIYMCNDLSRFLAYDLVRLEDPKNWFDFIYDQLYFIDVGLVAMGYLMSLRITDTHFRSAEPTMLGWTVALVCYQPFWSLIGRNYLAYDGGYTWGTWLASSPAVQGIWGACILGLTATYSWATIVFGARFSNLTHRGIITSGPYRYTKHPAYLAKNLSWWMISVPFLLQVSAAETLRHCLLLVGLNLIYLMRAKTEEWHLSRDPDYVRYAQWMEEHGFLRFIRHMPVLRHACYHAPANAGNGNPGRVK
jgi:protein-S-isoprenylcysteine O-methyltransferase Ste14